MKLRTKFLAPALAVAVVVPAALALLTAVVEGTALLNTNPPRKDGFEEITVTYKDGQGVTGTLSATATDINGAPEDEEDDPQTTESQKAQKIAAAINAAAQTEGAPVSAIAVPPDGVVVSSTDGGQINKIIKTNNTREKDFLALHPDVDEDSVTAITFEGSVSGLSVGGGGGSSVWIGASETEIQFPLTAAMDLDELRQDIADAFENEGFRTAVVGNTVTIVLPDEDARASFDFDDATLVTRFGITVL